MENLKLAIDLRDLDTFIITAKLLHPADLADSYEDLNESERDFFTSSLGAEKFAEVITELPDTIVESSMGRFSIPDQREILDQVSDDDRVDLLQDVSDETREKLLHLVEPDDIDVTRSLLSYSEDTAGGRMTTAFGKVSLRMTVKEALDELRESYQESENLSRVYVTDKTGKLIGRIRFRDLAFNTWDTPIRQIYRKCEHTISASADQEEAAQMFSKYDLIMLPVIDENERLLGIITYDDALEIIEEESREDIEKMAGMAGDVPEDSYLNTKINTHFKRRFPWILGLALLAIASGLVMMQFEEVLTNFFMLSLFLPMVVAAGGNTGGQASTMVIRAMALGELEKGTTARVAWKELKLGTLLGSSLALCVATLIIFIIPHLFGNQDDINYNMFGCTVALAITAQIMTSTLVGSLLPLGARRINIDPAIVAAPAITTIVDVSGMVIYFLIAKAILIG